MLNTKLKTKSNQQVPSCLNRHFSSVSNGNLKPLLLAKAFSPQGQINSNTLGSTRRQITAQHIMQKPPQKYDSSRK
jgi:hypothetical protein